MNNLRFLQNSLTCKEEISNNYYAVANVLSKLQLGEYNESKDIFDHQMR